ncbi:MAG: argininosuccinate lyase [Chloroflexi bacterium]|nr:argininosuccinate lyase [Chloroflexota bacterium]
MSSRSPDQKPDPAASARGSKLASEFTVSLHYDRRLYPQDIAGSIAHARMLARQGIIKQAAADSIVEGLRSIEIEIAEDRFPWRNDLEDLHMNIEARLFDLIGDTAGQLHTARSRNDQVSTDTRLYAKSLALEAVAGVRSVQSALLDQAAAHIETVLPGYTHMQRGQPVLLAHHLLAYFEMLDRDAGRFAAAGAAADVMPLGSGALAGVPYPIDRQSVADELGFSAISANSMDGVSDRDFALDFNYAAAVCMIHLSRLAEELIIWSTDEFGFVQLSDGYTSGSSMMPQKRNPDFAELTRGKTGRVVGHLMALMTTMKGLPLTYNRDLQEDKEGLFDAADTVISALEVAAGMISTAEFRPQKMREAAEASYVLATDVADYLVGKGMPFRQAHIVVTELTDKAAATGKYLRDLSLDDYRAASDLFDEDVLDVTVDSAIAARDVPGGTSPSRVAGALKAARDRLADAGNA